MIIILPNKSDSRLQMLLKKKKREKKYSEKEKKKKKLPSDSLHTPSVALSLSHFLLLSLFLSPFPVMSDYTKMTVAQLKTECTKLALDITGKKADLVQR